MEKFTNYIIISFFIGICAFSYGQNKIKRADKKYNNLSYINASEIYLKVAESGYKSKELFEKLGNSFYFNSNYQEAAKWYKELFTIVTADAIEPIYLLRYSQSLKSINEPEEARTYYDQFLQKIETNDSQLSTQDYIDRIELNSDRYDIKPVNINSTGIDFGSAILDEKRLVFSSSIDTGTIVKRRHSWNNLPFMDLYEAEIADDGNLFNPKKLKGSVNTKHHETSAAFTKDGKTMYFTRNNTTSKGRQKVQKLKIYRATLVNGKWSNVEDLPINSDDYSTAHPSLSADETKLYYTSNQPGGYGLTDIYVAPIHSNGKLGNPQNMGSLVNTKGRESFPYVTKNKEFYFSSDGHFGLGGYDVFYLDLKAHDPRLLNVGKPINSEFDDIAYVINSESKKGYVSSNRAGGKGYDDIYSFIETKPINKFTLSIFGKVVDKNTQDPISNSTISVFDKGETIVAKVRTDKNGDYHLEAEPNDFYLLRVEKRDYETQEIQISVKDEPNQFDFELEKEEIGVPIGGDVASVLNIKNIYFDLDKADILPKSEVELQKIITLMNTNPNLKLEIRSHTDSRATDAYNLELSNRRATSTKQYLVNKGITPSRLQAKGFGERQLVNKCSNGIKCTEAEHQENRRSEFIVIAN